MGRGTGKTVEATLEPRGTTETPETTAFVPSTLHPSTPPEYRGMLTEQSEQQLLLAYVNAKSYTEHVLVLHRLAQLRETHAVHGILSSDKYKQAKEQTAAAEAALAELEARLDAAVKATKEDDIDSLAEAEREAIESSILGYEWRYQLALDEARKLPEYAEIEQSLQKKAAGAVKDARSAEIRRGKIDKEIRKAIIKFGPTSDEVKKLRAERDQLPEAGGEVVVDTAELDAERAKVLKKLLGEEKVDANGERYFTGGTLDLSELYDARREEVQVQVEMQLIERRSDLFHDQHSDLRIQVENARAHLETVSQELRMHEAALARAKRRAQIARERVVSFEPQDLSETFERSAQERPGQLRAVFLQGSRFHDNLLYASYKRVKTAEKKRTVRIEQGAPDKLIDELVESTSMLDWQVQTAVDYAISQPVVIGSRVNRTDFEKHFETHAANVWSGASAEAKIALVDFAYNARGEAKTEVVHGEGKRAFHMFTEVIGSDNEHEIVKTLIDAGAKVTDNELEVPQYQSWADVKPGKRLTLHKDGATIHYVPHNSLSLKRNEPHEAPMSERGIFKVEGVSPEKSVEILTDLGFAEGMTKHIPYGLIYRGTHRFGRVLPQYEPLASGRDALKIPDGHMVIHGLTGVNGGPEAISRLKKIVESGGLKSIAERRRMEISVQSLSPLGDIASGTDLGVPTKIGKETHFGSTIFLGMHPDILNRRDVWFSDRDFGGGHNRFPEYTAYAKKIGQGEIYKPPSVEARQKHLDTGLGNSNEAYFRYEISWNEVDTIFVQAGIFGEVSAKVSEWKSAGLLPHSVRVEQFNEGPEMAPQQADSGEGWAIDQTTGELVFSLGSGNTTQTVADTSISGKIQRRAREIARSVE